METSCRLAMPVISTNREQQDFSQTPKRSVSLQNCMIAKAMGFTTEIFLGLKVKLSVG